MGTFTPFKKFSVFFVGTFTPFGKKWSKFGKGKNLYTIKFAAVFLCFTIQFVIFWKNIIYFKVFFACFFGIIHRFSAFFLFFAVFLLFWAFFIKKINFSHFFVCKRIKLACFYREIFPLFIPWKSPLCPLFFPCVGIFTTFEKFRLFLRGYSPPGAGNTHRFWPGIFSACYYTYNFTIIYNKRLDLTIFKKTLYKKKKFVYNHKK